MFIRDLQHDVGQIDEVLIGQGELPQRIAETRVEPGRGQHQIRLKLIRDPQQARRFDVDIATTKPGTPGGIFMRQFWHAIGRSIDLVPGKPKPLRIMSEDYTLYRGTGGKAHLTQYRCPHRGAQLHMGWVEEDDIRCPYHGWKFSGGTGQCVEMPAEEAGYEKKVKQNLEARTASMSS